LVESTTKRQGHGKAISYYGFGRTTLFACQFDQRFSYCLYVPRSYDEDGETTYPLAVIVHGTNRTAQE
jgi:predicted peptidase